MKKAIASLFLSIMLIHVSTACTTFLINKNGQLVFGRNYDWITDAGMVCTNLRGLAKTASENKNGTGAVWVSKYGSITFNQYGKEFPMGGMNEKGLVVELMWADGTRYPDADQRAVVGLLQWIQYQLDNSQTVAEVIATDKIIRIAPENPPCHFLVADANGKAATIEYYNGKLVMHTGNDLPFATLANSPYADALKAAQSANVSSGKASTTFQDNSMQRFTTACAMVQQYQQNKTDKPVTDYAFDVLDNVAQPGWTRWSIVYDISNKKISFKTAGYHEIKGISFDQFDFSCKATSMVMNMNQALIGNVRANFQPFSTSLNREIMSRAVKESYEQTRISDSEREAAIRYAESISCKN